MPKTHTTLSTNPELIWRAKEKGIVLSEIFEIALKQALGMSKKTDIWKIQLQEMQKIKMIELESINRELAELNNLSKKSKIKKKINNDWDKTQIQKETRAISQLTIAEFNFVALHRHKNINKSLNKNLTYEEYYTKFKKFIKK